MIIGWHKICGFNKWKFSSLLFKNTLSGAMVNQSWKCLKWELLFWPASLCLQFCRLSVQVGRVALTFDHLIVRSQTLACTIGPGSATSKAGLLTATPRNRYRMYGCAVHREIQHVGREPSWCWLTRYFMEALDTTSTCVNQCVTLATDTGYRALYDYRWRRRQAQTQNS